jgi:anti-sigma regulatory factor (Ser/Thr protein kinase)
MKNLTVPARLKYLEAVIHFITAELDGLDCPPKAAAHIGIATDEIFSNIAGYAYAPGTGEVTVSVTTASSPPAVTLTFRDSGLPYNPLERPEPDITLSAEEREPGGLGIFMTKKLMDAVAYQYENGQNVLTLKKSLLGHQTVTN